VQFYGLPRLAARVPASAFYPAPKVDSAIVRIDPHQELPVKDSEIAAFFKIVRAGFAQRRKQLRNALVHGLSLSREEVRQAMGRAGIDERRRAQSLSLVDWLALYQALSAEPDRGVKAEA
jgi:16S rRNA (adenine1518-N6/adenine1519-N6)-dimethyltransferase